MGQRPHHWDILSITNFFVQEGRFSLFRSWKVPLPEALIKETGAKDCGRAGTLPQYSCPSWLKRVEKQVLSLNTSLSGPVWDAAISARLPLLQKVHCFYGEGMPSSKMNTNPVTNRQLHVAPNELQPSQLAVLVHQAVGRGSRRKWSPARFIPQKTWVFIIRKAPWSGLVPMKLWKPEKECLHRAGVVAYTLPVASPNRNRQHKGAGGQWCNLSWAKLITWAEVNERASC